MSFKTNLDCYIFSDEELLDLGLMEVILTRVTMKSVLL